MADQLLLMLGPVVVGAVIGAWVALGRLYVARWGGPRLPRWIAPAMGALVLLAGLVAVATLMISASIGLGTGIAATPAAQRAAAALLALLLSPVWVLAASVAVLGIVTHYGLDRLLSWFRLNPFITEGLARGLRAAWAVLGLLLVGVRLQATYATWINRYGSTLETVLEGISAYQIMLSCVALGVAVLGMLAPALVALERAKVPPAPPAE